MEILSTWLVFIVLSITTLVTLVLSKFVAAIYKQRTYWKYKKVPYIKFKHASRLGWRLLLRRVSFIDYFRTMYDIDPDTRYIGTVDFTLPILLLRDPELIRDVTVKHFDHFTDHRAFFDEKVDPLFSKNIFALRGDRWRELRSILSPSFTASKMRFMFELISKCSLDFVTYLYDHPDSCTSMEAKENFSRYTNDVIATVAFGVNINSMEDRDNEFFARGKDISANFFSNMLKWLLIRFCPRLMIALGITAVPKRTANFFRKAISDNLKAREEQGIVRPDMLHLLTQAKDKETTDGGNRLTVDDIVSQAFIFFFAGFDSSSNLMCCMAYELALNMDVQEKLRREVDRCAEEGNGQIAYDDLSRMQYMDMVISETLRKYPVVIFVDRVCTKTFQFPPAADGYDPATLYPGDVLWVPVYSLHHDPKHFPDPDTFDPERFSEKNRDRIVPYTYLPFGAGPRKCIGDRFALMETKILMAHLLQRFVIKRTDKTQVPLVFKKASASPTPEGGFWLALEKRIF